MRVELIGLREIRELYLDPRNTRPDRSQLQFGMVLAGARLKEVVRHGNVIFSEVVDATGKSLIGPDTYDERTRTSTTSVDLTPDLIRRGGVQLGGKLDIAARSASTIAKMKGSVRVFYATEMEEITIVNPRGYMGSIIAHPRLKELGIDIKVLPPGDPRGMPRRDTFLAIQIQTKPEHVKGMEFFDAWMRPLIARPRPMKTNAGQDCTLYQISRGRLNEDSQMVIQVYPEVEEAEIPIEFHDVRLP